MTRSPYDVDLDRNPANFQPLTPLSFLERAAAVFPNHTAIIHGPLRRSYAEFYARTRRVLTRYAGVDYHSSRAEIAERVASRSSLNRERLEGLMRLCEETINGGPVNERQAIEMVKRLREVEGALGLRMRSRDVKQAAEKI